MITNDFILKVIQLFVFILWTVSKKPNWVELCSLFIQDLQLDKLYLESDQRKMPKPLKVHHVFKHKKKNTTVWKKQLKLNTAQSHHPDKQHISMTLQPSVSNTEGVGLNLSSGSIVLKHRIISHRTSVHMIRAMLCAVHTISVSYSKYSMPYCIHPVFLDFLNNF